MEWVNSHILPPYYQTNTTILRTYYILCTCITTTNGVLDDWSIYESGRTTYSNADNGLR